MAKSAEYAVLYTPEGEALGREEIPWNTYPRPMRQRDSFFCLNGIWELTVNGGEPEEIRVPFPPESVLSGVGRRLGPRPRLVYRRSFTLPDGFVRDRVFLHFGAVDQIAEVVLNGVPLGEHRGGYSAFSFEITEQIQQTNVLEVRVTDALDSGILPYGKQREKRGGMWYTPVTGIWQTVWMESTCARHVTDLQIQTDKTSAQITVSGVEEGRITVQTPTGEMQAPLHKGQARIVPENPRLWSPEDPWLYRFTLEAGEDTVSSYFALRTLEIRKIRGIPRLWLNGKPYFFHGLLDQGYWSDGLFTPAVPGAYEKDIRAMQEMGFNTLRKHIKVEPEQFYYDCDRLGMVVFQDMVNNGRYSFLRDTALPTLGFQLRNDRYMHRNPAARQAFRDAMTETVRQLGNHPCICCWTIFNEGWGQFDSGEMYRLLKTQDPSRFIDTASGWFAGGPSDVESPHIYFRPVKIRPSDKPVLLSEFGGYSCKPAGHAFDPVKTYGYRFFTAQADFEDALIRLYTEEILPAVEEGLCGAIYTQVSDVEEETNGLLSYDRRVTKADPRRMREMAQKLYRAMEETENSAGE